MQKNQTPQEILNLVVEGSVGWPLGHIYSEQEIFNESFRPENTSLQVEMSPDTTLSVESD